MYMYGQYEPIGIGLDAALFVAAPFSASGPLNFQCAIWKAAPSYPCMSDIPGKSAPSTKMGAPDHVR